MKLLFSSVFGIIGLFMMLFGCLFASVGGAVYYFLVYTSRDWVPVPGVVASFRSSTSTDSDGFTTTYYCPIVQYTSTNGDSREVELNDCASPPAYEAGDSVTVLYNPASPEQARIKGGTGDTLGNVIGIGFAVLGCLPALLGAVFCVGAVVNAARRSRPVGPTGPAGPPAPVVV